MLLQPPVNPFHGELQDGIAIARKIHHDLNLQLSVRHIDPNAPEKTAATIDGLAGKCEGIILSAPASPEIVAALGRVTATIPVVTVASDIDGCGRAAFIGPDDEHAGRVAGDLMGLFTRPDGGDILMVAGRLDFPGHRARARGFSDVLAEHHPHCRVAELVETNESDAVTEERVHEALKARPTIRGIYHISVGAVGVVRSLERLGRAGDVAVITHEATPERRKLLKERRIHAVIDQKPLLEARLAVRTMAQLLGRLDGEPRSIYTDIQIFMAENA